MSARKIRKAEVDVSHFEVYNNAFLVHTSLNSWQTLAGKHWSQHKTFDPSWFFLTSANEQACKRPSSHLQRFSLVIAEKNYSIAVYWIVAANWFCEYL